MDLTPQLEQPQDPQLPEQEQVEHELLELVKGGQSHLSLESTHQGPILDAGMRFLDSGEYESFV